MVVVVVCCVVLWGRFEGREAACQQRDRENQHASVLIMMVLPRPK